MNQFNYIVVVGKNELESQTIDVRNRDQSESIGQMNIEVFSQLLKSQYPPGIALPQKLYNSEKSDEKDAKDQA